MKKKKQKKDIKGWHNMGKKWNSYIVNESVIVTTYFEDCWHYLLKLIYPTILLLGMCLSECIRLSLYMYQEVSIFSRTLFIIGITGNNLTVQQQ